MAILIGAAGCEGSNRQPPVKPASAPSYAELCRRHDLKLPKAFHALVELAHEIAPEDPEGAFDDVGIARLELFAIDDESEADDPRWPGDDGRYADTPAEVAIFAWAGVDGVH